MKSNTVVATFHSQGYKPLADITLPRLRRYAKLHGYDLYDEEYHGAIEHTIGWERFRRVYELLFTYENVLWCDADALITSPAHPLHYFAGPLVMAADLHGANTGVFIARRLPLVRQLFYVVLGEYGRSHFGSHQWGEQAAFIHLTANAPYQKLVSWCSQKELNAYPNREQGWPDFIQGQWEMGDFIIQFAGMPLGARIEHAKKYSEMTEQSFTRECEEWGEE